jgi:hypothetical protein
MESSRNTIESNPITIIIQAHGGEDLDVGLIANRVQLLSISGAPGEMGLMSMCDDGNGNETSLDINVMNMLKETYMDPGVKGIAHHIIFNDILPYALKDEYDKCDIEFERNGGFKLTQPVSERTFMFKPNRHENCRRCTEVHGSKRCLEYRDQCKLYSPEYGLTVISASPEDKRFTLAGIDREIANLHLNLGTRTYWRNKLVKGSNSIVNFDKMFDSKKINLSELLAIFRDMGYVDIYIIDPTCRYCKPPTNTQEERLTAMRKLWLTPFEQIVHTNAKNKRETDYSKLVFSTLEIITFYRKSQNKNSRDTQELIQTQTQNDGKLSSNEINFYNVSSGMILTLSAIIAYFAYIYMNKRGGKKTRKNKNILSKLFKKGISKNTRYNRH